MCFHCLFRDSLVFSPLWTAAVKLLLFPNTKAFIGELLKGFRKGNKQLLIDLVRVLFWFVFTSIFWLDLHMQRIQTPHIILRNWLSSVAFCKYTLISPNGTIYFAWWKSTLHLYCHLITFSHSVSFLLIYMLHQLFLYSVWDILTCFWLTVLSYISFSYKCYSILFAFPTERKQSF